MLAFKRGSITIALTLLALVVLSACGGANTGNATGKIEVVAAENFYASIAQQIGGNHVNVSSILNSADVDPHEFDTNVNIAKSVSKAKLVIKNGGGYDNWMDKTLQSSPNADRVVITAFDIAKVKLDNNEHVWYDIDNAETVAQATADALKKSDAANAASYDQNLATFKGELAKVRQKITAIKAKYAGKPIGVTETIFMYQAGPLGLKVLTPVAFQEAIAEGTDAPVDAIATTENQVKNKEIKVLVYNSQTSTPLTTKLETEARAENIPITSITELMPANATYQSWMLSQLTSLEQALASAK